MGEQKEKQVLDKKERIKRKVIWILALLLILEIIGFSGYIFFKNYRDLKDKQKVISAYTKQIEELKQIKDSFGLSKLAEINPAFVGWLSCEDADIELPIVQANTSIDEEFYLSHDFYQESNVCGVPYVRSGADVHTTSNSTIVGHSAFYHFANGNSYILSNLYNYIENAEKVGNGSTDTFSYKIKIETLTATYTYTVFSVFTFAVNENYDTEYSIYDTKNFANETEFNTFYNNAKSLSVMSSSTTANYGDRFLTFMTCAKPSTSHRLMLVAKLDN